MPLQLPKSLHISKPWCRLKGSLATERCLRILKFLDAAKIGRHFIATRTTGMPAFFGRTRRIVVFVENSPDQVYRRLQLQKIRCLIDNWRDSGAVEGSVVNMRFKYKAWTWEFTFVCADLYREVDQFELFVMAVLAGHRTRYFQVRVNVNVGIYLEEDRVWHITLERSSGATSLLKRSAMAVTEALVRANPNSDPWFSAQGALEAHHTINRRLIEVADSLRSRYSWFVATFDEWRCFRVYVDAATEPSAYVDEGWGHFGKIVYVVLPAPAAHLCCDPEQAVQLGFDARLYWYIAVIPAGDGLKILHQ